MPQLAIFESLSQSLIQPVGAKQRNCVVRRSLRHSSWDCTCSIFVHGPSSYEVGEVCASSDSPPFSCQDLYKTVLWTIPLRMLINYYSIVVSSDLAYYGFNLPSEYKP